ncbi:MAG: ATP-binding protein [Chloroflexi bacterium]|nr:ATP-binding protein [Chloroflexota bacterium]MBI4505298.1 ATP-binding protein [Chloroflexota bacterium]
MTAPLTAPPRFYLLVGIPGSGKTTYARRHLADALRVSLDDVRLMLTGVAFDPAFEPYVVAAAHAALGALLRRAARWRRDVVLDATNITRQRRRYYLAIAARRAIPTVAVYLRCPLDVALVRNRQRSPAVPDDVVCRFHAALEPPTLDEGFAAIYEVVTARTSA